MVSIKKLREKSMTSDKKKNAKNDIFAFYVGRPISYLLTIPFLAVHMKPNTVSFLSLIPSIVGFCFCVIPGIDNGPVIGCLFFLLWNLMDGVDGNIARYTNQTSKLGAMWDAVSGYVAMICMYIAAGIVAFYETGNWIFISLGDGTALSAVFARLLLHKHITLFGEKKGDLNQKADYGIVRIIGLNLISYAGFMQVFLLLAALTGYVYLFTVVYFILNFGIMLMTMIKALRNE